VVRIGADFSVANWVRLWLMINASRDYSEESVELLFNNSSAMFFFFLVRLLSKYLLIDALLLRLH